MFFRLTVVSCQGEQRYNNAVDRIIIKILNTNWLLNTYVFLLQEFIYSQIFLKVLSCFPPSVNSHSTTPGSLTANPEFCSILTLLLGSPLSVEAPPHGYWISPSNPWCPMAKHQHPSWTLPSSDFLILKDTKGSKTKSKCQVTGKVPSFFFFTSGIQVNFHLPWGHVSSLLTCL